MHVTHLQQKAEKFKNIIEFHSRILRNIFTFDNRISNIWKRRVVKNAFSHSGCMFSTSYRTVSTLRNLLRKLDTLSILE